MTPENIQFSNNLFVFWGKLKEQYSDTEKQKEDNKNKEEKVKNSPLKSKTKLIREPSLKS